ncbi:MAG: acyl-CoA dehydrogenase family protein [Proteobacteria bacterium]|nr:acyl-CoA dehydrogenase family protein [Pseudomonadota bacterium]
MKNPFETNERKAFRDTMCSFVEKEIKPFADQWDEAGDFPWELHRKVGDLGCFGFGVDAQYGGLGFDDSFMRVAMFEELAKCGGSSNGVVMELV